MSYFFARGGASMVWKYADELEKEYREDLKPLQIKLREMKERKKVLRTQKKEYEEKGKWEQIPEITEEIKVLENRMSKIGPIISSSMYSIKWLHDAREPGNRREISRRSRYQRTQHWGYIEQVTFNKFRYEYEELTEIDMQRLDDYMSNLTEREKEAIVSIIGKGNSYGETAEYMGVTRSTVQTYLERGMAKIYSSLAEGVQTKLF